MRQEYCEESFELGKRKFAKLQVEKIHSCKSLTRKEAEEIIKREKNYNHFNLNEPREDQPNEMTIRKIDDLWHVYRTGETIHELAWSDMAFTVEEEAWGNLVMRFRADRRTTFSTKGINTKMTRQEAKRTIFRERLKYYNLNPKRKDGKNEIVIREIEGLWYVYFTNEKGVQEEGSELIFEQEERAWGFFVECLRNRPKGGDFFETMKKMKEKYGTNW